MAAERPSAAGQVAGEGRERGAFIRYVAMAGLLWLTASAAAIGLHVTASRSAWHDAFPLMARWSLLGLELFALAYPCFVFAIPVFLLLGRPDRPVPAERTRVIAAVTLVALPALAYAASWAVFRSTGHFLSRSTLTLWWGSRAEMADHVAHMQPLTPWLVGAGSVAFGVVAVLLLRRSRGGLRGVRAWATAGVSSALILSSLLLPNVIGWVAVDGFMRASRTDSTGPLLRVFADLRFRSASQSDPVYRDVQPLVETSPLVDMDDYVAGIAEARRNELADGPNVLVVVIESLRPDQLLAFGGERLVLPSVESLAEDGARFRRHYTPASHSDYADPTILSSHYPLRSATYHVYPESPPYPRVLIYDILGALGYRVGIFSSQNESWGGMKHYLDTGSVDRFLHSETYEGETYVPERDEGFAVWAADGRKSGKIDDRFTVGEAISWIDDSDDPFVIYMNLQNSHVPYVIPADFDAPFGSGRVSFPILFGSFPRDSVDAVRDLYSSSLAYVDSQLGRLIEHLRDSGRLENTIVVVTADTGQGFYEHDFSSHGGAVYDEVMKVPLLIHGPGVEGGDRESLSQHVDIAPTVLGLVGLPPHPAFQGHDLFDDTRAEPAAFLVGQALEDQYGVVKGDWKLIYDGLARRYELYDLASDPGETRDLAATDTDRVGELAPLLQAWRKAQLEYYASPANYETHYPPRLIGARLPTGSAATPEGDAGN